MQNVLYIFKDLPWYHSYILNKFSCSYYFNEYIINNNLNKTSQGISEEINSLIKEKKIEIIFFDFDYTSIIDKFFVNKIICKKKILVSFDPHENYKKIQDSLEYFSHLLIADPEYVEKLSLLNQNCFHFPLEANEKIFFNKKTKKNIDVLFFGELKADRKIFIEKIKKLNINFHSHINSRETLDDNALVDLINRSKIVINFSKGVNKYEKDEYYQFKGKVLISGMCGTLCLSEYSKGQDLIFKNNYPTFKNSEEMITIIKSLLNNEKNLNILTNNFFSECKMFSDTEYFSKIVKFLSLENNKNILDKDDKINHISIKNRIKIFSKESTSKVLLKETANIFKNLKNNLNLKNMYLIIYLSVIFLPFWLQSKIKNNKKK
jgi:hypothetical protein